LLIQFLKSTPYVIQLTENTTGFQVILEVADKYPYIAPELYGSGLHVLSKKKETQARKI